MDLLEQAKQVDTDKLCPYVWQLLNELIPILESLDPAKIDKESVIQVVRDRNEWVLEVRIEANDKVVTGFGLQASKAICCTDFAGGEMLECHHGAEEEGDVLIREVIGQVSRYMNGVTVVKEYDKQDVWIKTGYYWGINTEGDRDAHIGTSSEGLGLFSRRKSSERTEKVTYKFTR